ncbi:unnamed protein product [Adineta steineri]|nr:unnamed protein product [Adineta steineri]
MRRLFTWYLQIQFVYVLIFISCIAFCIWLQLVDIRTENTGELALSKMDQSSVLYTPYEFALATRCLLSPTTTVIDNISSYTYISWQRFSFFNNDMFNVKNIYYGTLHNHSVIFKKMAHQSEWITFDNCHYKSSCFRHLKSPLSTLLPCSNTTFISKFRNA